MTFWELVEAIPSWQWFLPDHCNDRLAYDLANYHMYLLARYGYEPVPPVIDTMDAYTHSTDQLWHSALKASFTRTAANYGFSPERERDAIKVSFRFACDAGHKAEAALQKWWMPLVDIHDPKHPIAQNAQELLNDLIHHVSSAVQWGILFPHDSNPYEPLLRLYSLGYTPFGPVDGHFVIAEYPDPALHSWVDWGLPE